MEITYLGHSSFKIKGKQASVVIDPFEPSFVGIKFPKVDADIVTISHNHDDHNKAEYVSNVKKVIQGPGEYEVNGVSIIGLSTYHDDEKGAKRGKNTIYVIEIDNMRLLHLGDLGHKLTDSDLKEIGVIDILFVPIGGTYTIDSKTAVEVAKQIGPSIIIPMHYKMSSSGLEGLLSVEDFISGLDMRVERLPKLNIKSGDIKSDEEYAVILEKK